ncbi:hypothetical protein [Sagittula sp. S175]|uniref:hypothetical protein n=1 Tax=Sagittula sp. S175 TaxID=3415129 RepID=UPI003C7EC91F
MVDKFRVSLIVLLLACSVPAWGGEYLIESYYTQVFPPSHRALAEMNFDGPDVTLTLRPLNGYPRKSTTIKGDNSIPGEVSFFWPQISGESGVLVFKKTIEDRHVYWKNESTQMVIWRSLDDSLSDADRTLTYPNWCGTPYGRVSFAMIASSDLRSVNDFLLSRRYIDSALSKSDSHSFLLGQYVDPSEILAFDLEVEVGTEASVALALRAFPGVQWADLTWGGGCGGSEIGYMAISSTGFATANYIDAQAFATALMQRVESYLGRSGFSSEVSLLEVKRSILPPYAPVVKLEVAAPSIVSRKIGDTWDSFNLIFQSTQAIPGVPPDKIGVVVWVERLKTGTKKVRSGDPPPRSEYIDVELRPFDEALVAYVFAEAISSEADGWCDFFVQEHAETREDFLITDYYNDCSGK